MAETLNFSNTQRIVLFIDLAPLLHFQNPNPNYTSYLKSILISSKHLLSFPSLSSSLFAFKFFYSSLSPLRSSSALHRLLPKLSSTSLSFNRPAETLPSLSAILDSLSTSSISTEFAASSSCASYVASGLLQLLHDYSWESQIESSSGTDWGFPIIRSNLVVLFSPSCKSLKGISEFMNVDINDECLKSSDGVCSKFRSLFGVVNDAFVSRDIHFSWIDVENQIDCTEKSVEIEQSGVELGLFEAGIRSLGWGFCSTNSIVLGSSVVPFGLIYPLLGANFSYLKHTKTSKSVRAQLSLAISDVSGKPLECKCCDLELLNLKISTSLNVSDIMDNLQLRNSEREGFDEDETFSSPFGDGITKIHVTEVRRYTDGLEIKMGASNSFLVRVSSGELEKNGKKYVDDFYVKRVLESLSTGMGEFVVQKDNVPIWQILMSFLYREGYMAVISISNRNGDSSFGILKPFTVHLALLSVINKTEILNKSGNSSVGDNVLLDGKRKKNKRQAYDDLSWSSFCKASFECCSYMNLEDAYFGREYVKSKRLKFLKCWMKQIKNCSSHQLSVQDSYNSHQETNKSEKPLLPNHSCEPSWMQKGDAVGSCSETSESFFCNLPKKIQQGLESEGVDLQILAERLVISSIQWLPQKCEMANVLEDQTGTLKSNQEVVAVELIKLLTKEPKELNGKLRDNGLSPQASDACSTTDYLVKEYELQIFLRMEILRSEVSDSIEEHTKQKLMKQICSFLEIIQYLVEGGFHGHVSLYDYVERNIKPRYSHTLANVIDKIYAEMDLLPFGEVNEAQVLLLNSEDSNQSWREKQDRSDTIRTNKIFESRSTEGKSSKSLEENLQEIRREEDHACKLSQARERRERAKRFVSFTSWIPDLQRVWAPKQPKPTKSKSDFAKKESKRKERRRASCSVVCETPMTGNKRTCSRSSIGDDEEQTHGSQTSSASISKALFQDDHW